MVAIWGPSGHAAGVSSTNLSSKWHPGRHVFSLFVHPRVLLVFPPFFSFMIPRMDFVIVFLGTATSISNVGPGLGEVIGAEGNFSSLPDPAKWVMSFGMLLGRLEIFTVLVMLSPGFWQR